MTADPTSSRASIVECTDFEGIKRAGEALRDGAVIVAQSDTNYGIFCNPFSRVACQRLYDMKRRDEGKPLTLFVSGPSDWNRWAYAPQSVDVITLTERFWPGPLNLVMRKKDIVPDWVTSGRDTVSIVHNISVPVNLLSIYSGLPLAATSANISGTMEQGLVTFEVAVNDVGSLVDVAIRGDLDSSFSRSSTIVSLVGDPTILRQGDLAAEELLEVVPDLVR
jgi:L-threonylcarbamoyladenylate synthase